MSERVMEIIVFIMNEMRLDQRVMGNKNFKVISKKLSEDGYTENEINSALTWVLERFKSDRRSVEVDQPQRLLHDFEKMTITPEAYGYLIQLKEFNLINEFEMEMIIERAMITDSVPVTLRHMKDIVSAIIFKPVDLTESSFFIMDDSYNVH